MNGKAVAGVVAVILIIGGLVLAMNSGEDKTDTETSTSNSSQATTNETSSDEATTSDQAEIATITYSGNGFNPDTVTVKAGSKVTVKNDSSSSLQFDSEPHPQHTDNPELNIGNISPGSSETITVTTTGSHGFHNHLNTGDTGTLTVE